MTALALLASTFLVVFALGLQSQLVNNGHYLSAFFNSLVIGGSQLVLFKLAPDATGIEIAAYLAGGPFGIVASMGAYRWLKRRRHPVKSSGLVGKPYPWPPAPGTEVSPINPPPKKP